MRKYWITAGMELTSRMDAHLLMVVGRYVLRFLRVAILLTIWRTILGGRGPVSGMTMDAVLTYTLIAAVFEEQLDCRTNATASLWFGDITTRFLRPMSVFGQFIAQMVGGWGLGLALFSVPLLVVAPLLGVAPFPATVWAGVCFIPSLLLAISVGSAIEFLTAAAMVRTGQGDYFVNQVRNVMAMLFSGAIIPLAFYPWGIGNVFDWLPFAAMASAPLRIYTGTGDPALLLASQAVWAVVLWPMTVWVWSVNRERLACYGG